MTDFLGNVVAPLGAALSALFAGLIWWLARKRLSPRYTLVVKNRPLPHVLALGIEILNRSDKDIIIEAISVNKPLSLLANNEGALYGGNANKEHLRNAIPVQRADDAIRRIEPEKSQGWSVVVAREGGFASCQKVFITLHLLKGRPMIRHQNKVLTAILPPSMRSETPSV